MAIIKGADKPNIKWTSDIILNAITCTTFCAPFTKLRYLCVPNITLTGKDKERGTAITTELDLLAVTKQGFCTEVEIKVSVSDVKADLKKYHDHSHPLIKSVYMALPLDIYEKSLPHIPERFGIITCELAEFDSTGKRYVYCDIKRAPKVSSNAIKATKEQISDFQRKAAMRYFTLLNKIINKKLNSGKAL